MINLYEYQKKVIETVKIIPNKRQLVSMPTGTGKTITFLSLAMELGLKTLILVHREELLNQTYEKTKLLQIPDNEVAIIASSSKGEAKKYTIAMVQTLSRNLHLYKDTDFDIIIVDEAHHSSAPSYLQIFSYFKVFENSKYLIGFTATPLRGDGKLLNDVFEVHSFKMTLSEATRNGYICPVRGLRVEMKKSLNEIDTVSGDYDISQLDKIMNCEEVNKCIVDRCQNLTKTPALLFCTSVDHSQTLSRMLRKSGKKAISVSYKTSKKVLEKIFQMLREGRIDYITNAVKLSEGFDFPPIQTVILARPTRSPVLYKQMIGRGLRKYEKKHECLVIEFGGSDPKMINWEDIDENCTFQSTPLTEQRSQKDAKDFYRQKFRSPDVKILDVRISPFKFYECYILRMESYKKMYRYIPFEEGILIGEIKKGRASNGVCSHNIMMHFLFWKERYQSFYQYDEPCYMYYNDLGWEIYRLEEMLWYFMERQPVKMGRWYPSEEETMSVQQTKLLGMPNMTARKAEMLIENKISMKIINDFIIPNKLPKNINEVVRI